MPIFYQTPPTFIEFLNVFLKVVIYLLHWGPHFFPLAVFVDTRSFSGGGGSLARYFVITGYLSI